VEEEGFQRAMADCWISETYAWHPFCSLSRKPLRFK
jgi:hypothetical protein